MLRNSSSHIKQNVSNKCLNTSIARHRISILYMYSYIQWNEWKKHFWILLQANTCTFLKANSSLYISAHCPLNLPFCGLLYVPSFVLLFCLLPSAKIKAKKSWEAKTVDVLSQVTVCSSPLLSSAYPGGVLFSFFIMVLFSVHGSTKSENADSGLLGSLWGRFSKDSYVKKVLFSCCFTDMRDSKNENID